jgi:hypothetical protein
MILNSHGQHVQTKKIGKNRIPLACWPKGLIDQFSVFPEWVRAVKVPNVDGMRD